MKERRKKRFYRCFCVAVINFVCTFFVVWFMIATFFPKTTITENGDLIVENIKSAIVDRLEIQEIEMNLTTLEAKPVYHDADIKFGDSKMVFEREVAEHVQNVIFKTDQGYEYRISYGEVLAIPKLSALVVIMVLYLFITVYFVPFVVSKFN